ncbi:MAG: hypothetical protein OEV49_05835 [candidate division Zixibacteria bacterium]|nr:hypothetical protein [candidate division Zixibacteria bacterium]MDH3938611.1 hypothetical protein [candidate division Zixibacteria bacterium]MDH4033943.1 hypothetical protein [candidate division Zixibacteria bacterium]
MATKAGAIPDELSECVLACIQAVEHVVENGGLVVDVGGEIFDEYRKGLSMRGQPGQGDVFMKWLHDHQWMDTLVDRVDITPTGDSYVEFPDHAELSDFDISDRKFVAVAKAHRDAPPILQATDSKWWGFKDALHSVGVSVTFLCPEYVRAKYEQKMDG